MASSVEVDTSCIPVQPSRVVYIIAPGSLVRLGPDLEGALCSVIASLRAAITGQHAIRHFATAYSRSNISIVLDFDVPSQDIQVFRLRQMKKKLTGYPDQGLSTRIADQLRAIQQNQPDIQIPFLCIEDWQGYGPKDHEIYQEMVKASTSMEAWESFKSVCMCLASPQKGC